jgi:hypothetical protein
MVISGRWLGLVVILLAAWLILLCRTWWKLLRTPPLESKPRLARNYVTIAGIGSSAVAVGALLALHLSWISAGISQHLGVAAIRILALLLFWPTLAGLVLCAAGVGRIRWLGLGTSLVTGLWWLSLSVDAAISMGAARQSRAIQRSFLFPRGTSDGSRYSMVKAPHRSKCRMAFMFAEFRRAAFSKHHPRSKTVGQRMNISTIPKMIRFGLYLIPGGAQVE